MPGLQGIFGKRPPFYGWVIAIAGSILFATCIGLQNSFGIFFKSLLVEFGWTRAQTSSVFSLNLITRGISGIVMGWLTDRFGPRLVILVGGIFLCLGLILTSYTSTMWQVYLYYSLMVGVGLGIASVPLLSTVSRWFVKRRGLALGVISAGGGAGTFIASPVAGYLILSSGWRMSYVALGFAALVITSLVSLVVRRNPEDMQLHPDGHISANSSETDNSVHDAEAGANSTSHVRRWGTYIKELAKERPVWLLFAVNFCGGIVTSIPLSHIVNHATDIGLEPFIAANILGTMGAASVLGRLLGGGLSDKIEVTKLLALALLIQGMATVCFLATPVVAVFFLLAATFGLAWGLCPPLTPAILAKYFGTDSMGAIWGLQLFGVTIGFTIGPTLAGYMYDLSHSYNAAFVLSAIFAGIGSLLCIFVGKALKKLGH